MTLNTRPQPDAIWRAVDIVCDAPTLLLMESVWLGTRRFDEFQRITGLMKAVVSARLKKLVAAGVLKKRLYCEKPKRYEYILDEKGAALFPVALMMLRWEQAWNASPERISVKLRHRHCGQNMSPICVCSHCSEEVQATDVTRSVHEHANTGAAGYMKRRRQAGLVKSRSGGTMLFDEISEIFGDRWSTLMLRAAFMGTSRYDGFLKETSVSTNILTTRLNWLIEKKLFTRKAYQKNPERYDYKLTSKGLGLYPILLFLLQWGEECFGDGAAPSMILKHKTCRRPLRAIAVCSACRRQLTIESLEVTDMNMTQSSKREL
ncbi:MAG: helix-turn-helix transcriptional regulator [Kordiimonadaceae bacterium]|nr:helix-turn-helix transcriptional regulator [Kordiimonadaceae bacterium]